MALGRERLSGGIVITLLLLLCYASIGWGVAYLIDRKKELTDYQVTFVILLWPIALLAFAVSHVLDW